jgi:hypothetical protein
MLKQGETDVLPDRAGDGPAPGMMQDTAGWRRDRQTSDIIQQESTMGSGFIDSFQLLIGIYLLYMGVKGENLGSRLSGVPDQNEVKEPRALRGLYIVGAG